LEKTRRLRLSSTGFEAKIPLMTKLEKIEREIESLPPQEMHALAAWFADLREKLWEREIEAGSPEMDALAARALEEHRAGKTTPLVRK
jgi:hypothetical protein